MNIIYDKPLSYYLLPEPQVSETLDPASVSIPYKTTLERFVLPEEIQYVFKIIL